MSPDQASATSLADTSPEELLALYGVAPADLERVRAYGTIIVPKLDELIRLIYVWMESHPDRDLLSDEETLKRVQSRQRAYWERFFEGNIDERYLESRQHLGEVHAHIGLSLPAYFSAMNLINHLLTVELYDGSLSHQEYVTAIDSVTKVVHLDTALVVEAYSRMVNESIAEQSQALVEMSTPVTVIWEGILMLPVVGIIDSKRAQAIMQAMLTKIAATQSKVIILDISGVAVVDTAVANHLIKITQATKLMGCVCMLSGISPPIAQTIVELGVEVGDIMTTSSLRDALEDAFTRRGLGIRPSARTP
ncbi:protoglobin domain-containing protein [Polyangium sp. 15x6]|uniref:protoglobin domain-containing protein n=1 Tax=Polyangium sp. 15x6 TaxID=3042687 RepID=UPI00249ABF10|nr:protoglobin domain-containing protein [Polyangium sp. 15x6]MDI3291224.1 protoglobin domain-containing protein [Polyangium sp. 15x6]